MGGAMMMPPQIRSPNARYPMNHAIRAHISPDAAESRTIGESERTLMSSPYFAMVASRPTSVRSRRLSLVRRRPSLVEVASGRLPGPVIENEAALKQPAGHNPAGS
jgi:hypothetical protein